MISRNARIGLWLFGVYALFYAAFVLTNALAADVMERTVLAGLNLAVVSGFGLIVLAMVLALVYGVAADSVEPASAEVEPATTGPLASDASATADRETNR